MPATIFFKWEEVHLTPYGNTYNNIVTEFGRFTTVILVSRLFFWHVRKINALPEEYLLTL